MAAEGSSIDTEGKKRRTSVIEFEKLDLHVTTVKVENLSDAKLIKQDELDALIRQLRGFDGADNENEEILRTVEAEKIPFLFSSASLLKILDVTPSIKTRMAIISHIGPRLTDPKAKSSELVGLFRFAEEKSKVEEILKARTSTINSSVFKQTSSNIAPGGGAGTGRGGPGRGGAGRGGLEGRGKSKSAPSEDALVDSTKQRKKTEIVTPVSEASASQAQESNDSSVEVAKKPQPFVLKARSKTQYTSTSSGAVKVAAPPQVAEKPAAVQPEATKKAPAAPIVSPKIGRNGDSSKLGTGSSLAPAPASAPAPALLSPAVAKSVTPKPMSRASSEEDFEAKAEIDSVIKCLGMDEQKAEEVSRELEMWEMLVVSVKSEEADYASPSKSRGAMSSLFPITSGSKTLSGDESGANDEDPSTPGGGTNETKPRRRSTVSEVTKAFSKGVSDLVKVFGRGAEYVSPTASPTTPSYMRDVNSTVGTPNTVGSLSPFATAAPKKRASMISFSPGKGAGVGEEMRSNMTSNLSPQQKEAAAPSFALGVDPKTFLEMAPEPPVGKDETNRLLFSYAELVRRNYVKDFEGVTQTEMEMSLTNEEFKVKFGISKEDYVKQPKWRRIAQKKALLLF